VQGSTLENFQKCGVRIFYIYRVIVLRNYSLNVLQITQQSEMERIAT
jgi:hypothetical protein